MNGGTHQLQIAQSAPAPGVCPAIRPPAIQLDDVSHVFETPDGRPYAALERVSLAIAPGSFSAIVGPSGCGKTTLLTFLLHQHGVAPDQVSITAIGTAATAVAAIEHAKVDAGMMTDPAFTRVARRHPGVRVLADLRHAEGVRAALGTETYPASVLYASRTWIAAHRDTAARLARAMRRTLEWMQAHSPEEIAGRAPAAFRGDDEALYVEALRNPMSMYSADGVMTREGADAVHRVMAQSMEKVRTAGVDVSKTYTNEFVQPAEPR